MSELAALITAGTGLLVALGAALKFLWNKLEARFTAIEKRGQECEARSSVQLRVIELLWQEVKRLADGPSAVLARAEHLMDSLKGPAE